MGFLKDMISSYQKKKFENVKSSDESIWNIWMSRRNQKMNVYKNLLVAGLIFFVPAVSNGQRDRLLTLDESITIALHKNYSIKSAEYTLQQRDAQVLSAYSLILPRINVSSGKSRFLQGVTSNIGAVQGVDANGNPTIISQVFTSPYFQQDNHSFGLNISQNIYDGGGWWNNIAQAKSFQTSGFHALESAKNDAVFLITQQYLQLSKATALQYALFDALMLSQEQLERTKSLYELGSVARTDLFKARVQLGNDKSNLLMQQNVVAAAKSSLNLAMGRDPLTPIRLEEKEYTNVEYPSREEAIDIAKKNSPRIKQFEAAVSGAKHGKKVAKSAFYPSLSASIQYSRSNQDIGSVFNPSNISNNWQSNLGVSLNLNIFNGFADKANLEQSQAIYNSSREDLENSNRGLIARIDDAITKLETYEELESIFEENLQSATEDLRLATERYGLGSATLLEVQDAQVAVLRANTSVIRNKYDSQIAYAQLMNTMGQIR